MTQMTNPQRGFTLLEVLLAIAITATVMVTVGTTFHVLLNARDVVDDLSESTEAGPRILNLVERDLRGLWTFNVQNNAVFRGRNMDVNGRDADRMDFLTSTDATGFVRDLNDRALKPTVNEVGYWFKPNPRYRDVFEMWRREDPMVDDDLIAQGSFQLVHDRVKSFKVTYFRTLGSEAEELLEWDSANEDALPKRLKIEFTIERRRSSRNLVSDGEVDDFEGAEKTYVRHFVFDDELNEILAAGTARMPVLPPEPQGNGGGPIGPAGAGGAGGPAGPAGPGGPGKGGSPISVGDGFPGGDGGRNPGGQGRGPGGQGRGPGGQGGGQGNPGPGQGGQRPSFPPGFDPGQFFRPGGGAGGGAGGGLGGIFGGGG